MKRLAMILALAAGLICAANVTMAQDGDTEPAKPKKVRGPKKERTPKKRAPRVQGKYAAMAKVCTLTEEQQKKIVDIAAANAKAGKEWREANAEKLKEARDKMKAAQKAKDKEAMKTAMEEMKALNADRAAASKRADADIMAVLTDEQKAAWKAHEDAQMILAKFRRAKLTEEQTAKAKEVIAAGLKDVDRSDKEKVAAAMKTIDESIRADVLTDEQREAVKPKARPEKKPVVRKPRVKKSPDKKVPLPPEPAE